MQAIKLLQEIKCWINTDLVETQREAMLRYLEEKMKRTNEIHWIEHSHPF